MQKNGIQIFDKDGELLLEVGSHIARESPFLAEKIGKIAASWAQIEASLNCLFATLLNKTPTEASKEINKFRNAARATQAARDLATKTLNGRELESIAKILDELDLVRERRNRIQHDIWAKKGKDEVKFFAVSASQYLKFTTKIIAILESSLAEEEKYESFIDLANDFAKEIENSFTINDLQEIDQKINDLDQKLTSAMFFRISQHLLHQKSQIQATNL